MWLVAQEVERVADPDLVPLAGDVEDQRALEGEDQFLAGMDQWFVAAVRTGLDGGECGCTAKRGVGPGDAGESQAGVGGEEGGAFRGWRERHRPGQIACTL